MPSRPTRHRHHVGKTPSLTMSLSASRPFAVSLASPVGVRRGVKTCCARRGSRIYKGPGRPVSRILLYPAIHLRGIPGLPSGKLRLPAGRDASGQFGLLAPVVYLAGPSRDTAGGLLPHPFTHHLCRVVGRFANRPYRPSAGLLSVALDVTGGLRRLARG